MPRQPAAVNNPLPSPVASDGTRRPPRRRYHYLTVAVDADPETVADECNRLAGEGYTMVSTLSVPRTGRTEVLITFARRLRARRGHPVEATEVIPLANLTASEAEPEADTEEREGSES